MTGGNGVQFQWDFDDGTPLTPFSSQATITHQFAEPGIHYVTVTARDACGNYAVDDDRPARALPADGQPAGDLRQLAFEDRADRCRPPVGRQPGQRLGQRLQSTTTHAARQIPVGTAPRSLAISPKARSGSRTSERHDQRHRFRGASAVTPDDRAAVRLAALRHRRLADGELMYVALEGPRPPAQDRFGDRQRAREPRCRPQPAPPLRDRRRQRDLRVAVRHATAARRKHGRRADDVGGQPVGGEVVVVNAAAMTPLQTIVLRHGDKPDFENQGRGIPNYLGAVAISPDGRSAWVPSKQDNVKRGARRDGLNLNFQNTVRAISSRIDLVAGTEDYATPHRPRQLRRRERDRIRPSGRLHVRRARDEPAGRGRRRPRRATRSSASTSGARRRASRSRPTATGSTSTTSWTARSASIDSVGTADGGQSRTCRYWPRGRLHTSEKLSVAGAARQAALLRRARHASRARWLHQLRVLPQ